MGNGNVTRDVRAPAADDNAPTKKFLAMNIYAERKRLRLSRTALAEKVGTNEANLGQYERGKRTPPIDIICKLADVFNVSTDFLLGRSDENYDAVKEFRFDEARKFACSQGFSVLETFKGIIEICMCNESLPPDFLSGKTPVPIVTVAEFDNRQSFVDFIEHFEAFILYHSREIFADCVKSVGRKKPFAPDFKIKYEGNLAEK